MSKIVEKITALAKPVVESLGLELWDVEYVSEAGRRYLRLYIDSPDGVSIDDCERVSRAIDPVLDEADPIPESYTFEVSSAGADRQLKKPSDFQRFMGSKVEVKLYKPVNGRKEHVGELTGFSDGNVILRWGNKEVTFDRADIARVRLYVEL